uniref:G protein signaling modulator 1a n=1 Tax=Cyprinus carpio TaxID=7962 RepID=A0A8C1N337_CYPCA
MENRRCQHPQQSNTQAQEASSGPQSSMPQSPLLSGASSLISRTQTEEFFDLIASSQSRRLDDQRANVRCTNVIYTYVPQTSCLHVVNFLTSLPLQSSRINDQRCSLPPAPDPDEDFFSLIQRVQSKRMDEQRVNPNSTDVILRKWKHSHVCMFQ